MSARWINVPLAKLATTTSAATNGVGCLDGKLNRTIPRDLLRFKILRPNLLIILLALPLEYAKTLLFTPDILAGVTDRRLRTRVGVYKLNIL